MRIRKEKEERSQELVEVAERLFLTKGYEETGISDIVRAANVAQGTFYYHFKSKDDILAAVARKTAGELEQRVIRIIGNKRMAPEKRLRNVLVSLFAFMSEKKDLIVYIHSDANALLHHRLTGTTVTMIRKHLLDLIQEGAVLGRFHIAHPEETVDFFLGGLGGVLHMPGLCTDPARTKRFMQTAELTLVRGLGVEGTSSH
jgi:AcrR family transcriptional regulator